MGTIHVPTLLEGILEATAAEAAAKARITTLRAALEDEARRRLAAEGAAPSWNTPQLGKVRLDPPGDWTATVADENAFTNYVAEHYSTEATVAIHINAADAEDALKALEFIGVDPIEARVEVRTAWREPFLKGLAVDVTEERDDNAQVTRTVVAADAATGEVVPGIGVTRSEARLVVSLDRDRRTAAITQARTTATALVEAAADDTEDEPVDLEALDVRRRELEDLHADQLATIAEGHGLGKSGTKAALAERIARAELATGHVIRPASDPSLGREWVDQQHGDGPEPPEDANGLVLPEGTEVEEVSTVPLDPEEAADLAEVEAAPEVALAWDDDRPGCMRVHVAQERALALDDAYSREVLRHYAKARGLSAAGTKADVIGRLVEAGVTAATLTYVATAQESTP